MNEADGVLARLGQFFEAAAEHAKASETDEGWELSYRFEDTSSTLSELSNELHDAGDRFRDVAPADQPSWQASVARYYATAPPPRAAPTAGDDHASPAPAPAPTPPAPPIRRTR